MASNGRTRTGWPEGSSRTSPAVRGRRHVAGPARARAACSRRHADFARRRPGTFLALAAGVGVVAGRLSRSLADEARDSDSAPDHPGDGQRRNGSAPLSGDVHAAGPAPASIGARRRHEHGRRASADRHEPGELDRVDTDDVRGHPPTVASRQRDRSVAGAARRRTGRRSRSHPTAPPRPSRRGPPGHRRRTMTTLASSGVTDDRAADPARPAGPVVAVRRRAARRHHRRPVDAAAPGDRRSPRPSSGRRRTTPRPRRACSPAPPSPATSR